MCFDGGEKVSSLCICAIHSDFNKKNLSQIYFSKIASSLTLFTGRVLRVRIKSNLNPNSQDLISNSPYHLPYNSCDVSSKNLVLDQIIIPFLIMLLSFLSVWYCIDIVRRNSVLNTHGS